MNLKKVVTLSIFLVSSFFLLGVCAFGQGASLEVASVGRPAPDFTLQDLNGKKVALKSLQGSPVLLVFGATWCPYCVKEIPDLNKFYDDYTKRGLVILSIDINESQTKVASFAKQKGIKYKVLLDSDGRVSEMYGVRGIPTNVLIDKKGIVKYLNHPIPSRAEIEKIL